MFSLGQLVSHCRNSKPHRTCSGARARARAGACSRIQLWYWINSGVHNPFLCLVSRSHACIHPWQCLGSMSSKARKWMVGQCWMLLCPDMGKDVHTGKRSCFEGPTSLSSSSFPIYYLVHVFLCVCVDVWATCHGVCGVRRQLWLSVFTSDLLWDNI